MISCNTNGFILIDGVLYTDVTYLIIEIPRMKLTIEAQIIIRPLLGKQFFALFNNEKIFIYLLHKTLTKFADSLFS